MQRLQSLSFLLLLLGFSSLLKAESPRTALQGTPKIMGKEIREFVLVAPIQVGTRLPPGLPTTVTYVMPNHFIAAGEDADGVFYQCVERFTKGGQSTAQSGLYVTSAPPIQFVPYLGNARYLKMRLMYANPLSPSELHEVHFVRPAAKK